MRAGVLRERIELLAEERTQDASGAVRKHWRTLATVRCSKLRMIYRYDRDGIVGKEEFDPMGARFIIRYCPMVERAERVRYRGILFRITMPEYNQRDRSVTLFTERVNL